MSSSYYADGVMLGNELSRKALISAEAPILADPRYALYEPQIVNGNETTRQLGGLVSELVDMRHTDGDYWPVDTEAQTLAEELVLHGVIDGAKVAGSFTRAQMAEISTPEEAA